MAYGLHNLRVISYAWWVGYYLRRAFNFDGLCVSIKGMIASVKGMDIKPLPAEQLLMRFNHVIDKNRALEGCPWSFEKNVMILSSIGDKENPMDVDLSWCDFHVYVHDLPLSKMNLGVVTLIGNKLGKFRDMEMDAAGCSWGERCASGVAINVTLPLTRAL
ncbi:hypothetical protein Salat_0152700 [Sesamum alatum]|uniref:DUF4283 domain-containing protein n=1 Tax=Sesamum alatum TaxID=300844 RepID=A0AAE2CXM2_9LAMI|nr:hypothetical protein Salat_0152700 [Sesamum alatum]